MDARASLVQQFEDHRGHLRRVAYRMLGSPSEAEDAVQEAWLHASRVDTSTVENFGGWLTRIVARVCLDWLRSRKARPEEPLDDGAHAEHAPPPQLRSASDPEEAAALADSVGLAMLVVLDRLAPIERIAFVMHDLVGASFEEIAEIIDRSPAAARQIASRARRRVNGGSAGQRKDLARQRETVDAFIAALRAGDFNGLLAVLDPDVVVRGDRAAVAAGAATELRGAEASARQTLRLSRGARLARVALVDGAVGIIVAPGGRLMTALKLAFEGGRIVRVDVVAEPERLRQLDIALAAPAR